MKPPTSVQVGATRYRIRCSAKATREIRKGNKDENLAGLCQADKATITVAHDLPPDVMRDTTLHEVMHACYFQVGNPVHIKQPKGGDSAEEVAVSSLSPMLLLVLRDNPEVVDYLLHWDDE